GDGRYFGAARRELRRARLPGEQPRARSGDRCRHRRRPVALLRAAVRHGAARRTRRRPGAHDRPRGARRAVAAQPDRRIPPVQHERERGRLRLQRYGRTGRREPAAGRRAARRARRLGRRSAGGGGRGVSKEAGVTTIRSRGAARTLRDGVDRAGAAARALAWATLAAATLLAAGCDRGGGQAPPPSPNEVLAEATGYYCGMLLADHEGPKGQIHLSGREAPLWFSSVRDTIAFLRLPEE